MDPLIRHLRSLAGRRSGVAREDPTHPGIARRAVALRELADLLENEPMLVRKEVRMTIDLHVFNPIPEAPSPVLSERAECIVIAHGWDGPESSVGHLRLLDALAGALVHDRWDMVRGLRDMVFDGDMAVAGFAELTGLHGFEVEAAVADGDPGPGYFVARPGRSSGDLRDALYLAVHGGA